MILRFFLAGIVLLFPLRFALAADPGDNCSAALKNSWEVSASSPKVRIFCDGSKWRILEKIDDSGNSASAVKKVITFGSETATCNTDIAGTIRYTSGVPPWEFCDGSGWRSFDGVASGGCVPPPLCPNIGDTCNDGNAGNDPDPKFAGFMAYNSTQTCEAVYVTQANQGTTSTWKTSTGTNDISSDSLEEGSINDAQIANSSTFPAFKVCKDLVYGGFTDWYLPARDELHLLWRNKTAIGSFTEAYYVSSSEYDTTQYWNLGFDYGGHDLSTKNSANRVRCIRRDGCSYLGGVCSDGTVFAGISPDGNVPMYATPCDSGQTWDGTACTGTRATDPWNNGQTDYVNTSIVDCATYGACSVSGSANTAILVSEDSDSNDAGRQDHMAAKYCDDLTFGGKSDWYLPSYAELLVLYANRSDIGNFDTSGLYYWSSSEQDISHAWVKRFSNGTDGDASKYYTTLITRCVRKG